MAGGGVGEASLVFGGWQPRGQPESFRSVEAHLGLGRFTLISKQEQKVSAWRAVLHLPWMPQQRWGSVVDHSWGSSCPVCARPLRTPPPLSFSRTPSTFFFPPLEARFYFPIKLLSILRNAARGAFSKAPCRPNCKRKRRRKRGDGRKQNNPDFPPCPSHLNTSTLQQLSSRPHQVGGRCQIYHQSASSL